MSFLDLDERIVELAKLVDIVHCPIADTKEIPPVDVGLVEGGICNEHNLHVLKDLRAKAKVLVSMGDCAGFGCVPMLRNQFEPQDVLDRAYVAGESTALGPGPRGSGVAQADGQGPPDPRVREGGRLHPRLPAERGGDLGGADEPAGRQAGGVRRRRESLRLGRQWLCEQ